MLILKALGYRDVKSVRGGLDAWVAAELPTRSS
jgi:rhodanese-related sulfurtransferase